MKPQRKSGSLAVAPMPWLFIAFFGLAWCNAQSRLNPLKEYNQMSVDVELQLFSLEKYERVLLPAYHAFMDKGDTAPLAKLLRQAIAEAPAKEGKLELVHSADSYQHDLDILEGREYYAPSEEGGRTSQTRRTSPENLRQYVKENIAPSLAYILYSEMRPDVPNTINLSRPKLVPYLYQHSNWIESVFTFALSLKGPYLEVPLGESTQLLTEEEVRRLYQEVTAVPRPTGDRSVQQEYDGFVLFLKTAIQTPGLTVVLSVT